MIQTRYAVAAVALSILAAACSGDPGHTPILTCETANGIEPDCRFMNPEDIVVSPSGRQLLISQMARLDGSLSGSMIALNPATGEIVTLFPTDGAAVEPGEDWGETDCPRFTEASAFTPHGIDVELRDDGRHELFVVNHGQRESVELFEIVETDTSIALEYRGCVAGEEGHSYNDVVGHPNGTFWVTHTRSHFGGQTLTALRMMLTSLAPGRVVTWSADGGLREMEGLEAQYANGIERSADGRYVFVASYFAKELIKFDVTTGSVVDRTPVPHPDNLAWAPTGEILVAGHDAPITEINTCLSLTEGSCGIRFEVLAVDPDTMKARSLIGNEGAPMGAATIAVPHGEHIYLGTFAGDRIARVSADVLMR